MTFLTILEVTEKLCSFKLVLEGKTGKVIPEASRLEFLEKFPANNFALSDTEDNTSGPLNGGGIEDLTLLRTLLAIHQKSRMTNTCPFDIVLQVLKVHLVKICKISNQILYFLLFLLAFTSAGIIFHKLLQLHSILSVKRIFVKFSFFNRFTQTPPPPPP